MGTAEPAGSHPTPPPSQSDAPAPTPKPAVAVTRVARVKFALLGSSGSGSSWVNHMLNSHPCISSANEYLKGNTSELALFHAGPKGVAVVLDRILDQVDEHLRQRRRGSAEARACKRVAAGVKFKTLARDVVPGPTGNLRPVSNQLAQKGWRVVLLQRRNHLGQYLGQVSRQKTGSMHCLRNCDPFHLNVTTNLNCNRTLNKMNAWEELKGELDTEFRRWRGSGRFVSLIYEELLRSPRDWARAMNVLGFLPEEACRMQTSRQKRVQQTQREMIRNWDNFSACVHTHAPHFGGLLNPDDRPHSGPLPKEDASMCGGAGRLIREQSSVETSRTRRVL